MNGRAKGQRRFDSQTGLAAARLSPSMPTAAAPPRQPAALAGTNPNDLQLLAEIGLSAAARGMGMRAEPIFEALASLHPENAAAAIGRALTALARRDSDHAIEILKRDGIGAKVCAAEAQALLAIALTMAGRNAEARTICQTLAYGKNGPARQVAQGLLAEEMVDA